MVEPEREVEKELERDSNEVEMSLMLSSPSPMDLCLDDSLFNLDSFFLDPGFSIDVSSVNFSPSRVDPFLDFWQTHIPKSPRPGNFNWIVSSAQPMDLSFDNPSFSPRNFPSPSRVAPSPEPGLSQLISSDGNASSSTQPMDLSFDNPSFSPRNSPSPTRVAPFPDPGLSQLIFSDGNASSSTFPPVLLDFHLRYCSSLRLYNCHTIEIEVSYIRVAKKFSTKTSLVKVRELKLLNLWNCSTLRLCNCHTMEIEVSYIRVPKKLSTKISLVGVRELKFLKPWNCSALWYHGCHVQGKLASPGFAPSRNIIVTKTEGGIHSAVSHPENEGNKKTSKRKIITPEDLQHFRGRRKDAAIFFKVSESTIKRRRKQFGITDWRYRNRDKDNQSLSKPKDIIQMAGGSISCDRELNPEQIDFPPESEKGSDRSQIGVGLMEESSIHMEITPAGDMFASSTHEQCIEAGDPLELPVQPSELSLSTACLSPDAVNFTLPQTPGKLLTTTEAFSTEQVPDSSRTNLSCSDLAPKLAKATAAHMMSLVTETQDTRTVTIKARYGEFKIRFKLPLTSGIMELRKKVAERLLLGVRTFSIEYLDEEKDWILMTGDEDLQECFNNAISLRRNVDIRLAGVDIRLLIRDIRFC